MFESRTRIDNTRVTHNRNSVILRGNGRRCDGGAERRRKDRCCRTRIVVVVRRTGVVIQTIPSRKEFPAAACYYPSSGPLDGACTRLHPSFPIVSRCNRDRTSLLRRSWPPNQTPSTRRSIVEQFVFASMNGITLASNRRD